MYIAAAPQNLADGTSLTEFSGVAREKEVNYVFPVAQNSLYFRNLGSSAITLKLRGSTYTLAGGQWENISGNVKYFTVSASEPTGFTLQGRNDPRRANKKSQKPIAIATRCSAYHVGSTMAGSIAGTTYRYSHVMRTPSSDIQLVYGNHYPTQSSESSNANAITIAVAIEYEGKATRIQFNGAAEVTIGQGGMVLSDPIQREDIPEGATFYTRTYVKTAVDTTDLVPQTILMNGSGDGKAAGNVAVATGALTSATSEKGYGPSAIVGIPHDPDALAFGLFGDSIVADDSGNGWPVQMVDEDHGYIILSKSGSAIDSLTFNSPNRYRLRYAQFITHAIVNYGTNDFNGPVAFEEQIGKFEDLWEFLQNSGIDVYHATTLPRTTSSDSWATEVNQTVVTANSYNTKRAEFNADLRAGAYKVRVLDIASAAESAAGASGVWKGGYTADGVHPGQTAQDAIVAATDLDLG